MLLKKNKRQRYADGFLCLEVGCKMNTEERLLCTAKANRYSIERGLVLVYQTVSHSYSGANCKNNNNNNNDLKRLILKYVKMMVNMAGSTCFMITGFRDRFLKL